jgi:MOSC domain-containing protein YiiM
VIRIRHLYLAPGHSYFGRHGAEAADHPMVEVDAVECVAGRGLRGDRFFDYKPDYKGQITFFAGEHLDQLRVALELPAVDPASPRRNVVTEGADLAAWIGREFEIQGVRFAGTEECRPCYWMNAALRHPGAEEWLAGKGGLRARILTDGTLRRDDFQ